MQLPDVNVLIYAHRQDAPEHDRYAAWLRALVEAKEPFAVAAYRRFCQESLQSGAPEAASALYANLANALFARIYAKLLIPRLGT